MKTKSIFASCLITTLAIGLSITSCKKDDKTTPSASNPPTTNNEAALEAEAEEATSDNEQGEFVSSDATNIADQAEDGNNSFKTSNGLYANCATITVNSKPVTGNKPSYMDSAKIEIDFGTKPCQCNDLRYRQGKIIINRNKRPHVAGASRTITFENYYVGKSDTAMHKVEGTQSVTFNGKDSVTKHLSWTIKAENIKITSTKGKYHSWNSTRTREWIAGYDSASIFNWSDDKYSLTGSSSGVNVNGKSYSAVITKALIRDMSCMSKKKFHFTSGTIKITHDNKKEGTIDFGDGTCDAKITVTVAGKSKDIKLH